MTPVSPVLTNSDLPADEMLPGEELQALNSAIEQAKERRREWLERNYMSLARFKIGDKIYAEVAADNYRLRPAGVVNKLYFVHEGDRCEVHYSFTPSRDYPYGSNTESEWAHFYDEARWQQHLATEISRLQRQVQKMDTE